MALCKNCGTNLAEGSKFCVKCGQRQDGVPEPSAGFMSAAERWKEAPPVINEFVPRNQWYEQRAQELPDTEDATEETGISIPDVYKQVLHILSNKPIKLWGISMLGTLLAGMVPVLAILPIVSIPICLVLSFGLTGIYIRGSRHEEPEAEQLFCGFKNFWKTVKVMGWKLLWVFLWGLIPIAGIFIAVMKEYSYKFVPHILSEAGDISSDDALKMSAELTKGHRLKMFAADLIIILVTGIGIISFAIGTRIWPFEVFFVVLLVLWSVLIVTFIPLIMGLVSAVFYDRLAKREE